MEVDNKERDELAAFQLHTYGEFDHQTALEKKGQLKELQLLKQKQASYGPAEGTLNSRRRQAKRRRDFSNSEKERQKAYFSGKYPQLYEFMKQVKKARTIPSDVLLLFARLIFNLSKGVFYDRNTEYGRRIQNDVLDQIKLMVFNKDPRTLTYPFLMHYVYIFRKHLIPILLDKIDSIKHIFAEGNQEMQDDLNGLYEYFEKWAAPEFQIRIGTQGRQMLEDVFQKIMINLGEVMVYSGVKIYNYMNNVKAFIAGKKTLRNSVIIFSINEEKTVREVFSHVSQIMREENVVPEASRIWYKEDTQNWKHWVDAGVDVNVAENTKFLMYLVSGNETPAFVQDEFQHNVTHTDALRDVGDDPTYRGIDWTMMPGVDPFTTKTYKELGGEDEDEELGDVNEELLAEDDEELLAEDDEPIAKRRRGGSRNKPKSKKKKSKKKKSKKKKKAKKYGTKKMLKNRKKSYKTRAQ